MIFVDSSVWIDFFNGNLSIQTNRLDSLLGTEPIGLGDLVLIEVLQGFRHDRDYETAKELLTSLTIFDLGGQDIAVRSADNFRFLRKRGVTVRKTIDVMIATYCINNNLPLLHSDKDFEPFHLHLNLQNAISDT
ncbi:MAG: twitching motility protein PilT [Gammaproteobacteria bacterium (ex Lamellibrachia satsuma)]|nr:MAG: PIN domain nuclease [Gammaproteobacteria bacterium (ex Lamellibrachia satsuma)]RRS30365.1 MAG: twitching motility protein PilT [Gammaproteobacteria bacterium (ex Lamellibrachia satsuma)]RRS36763.1 MAG: twitching motility protein PilT [Gammaproteobacteria bacterium (ex Lamellibrachia satsuma)]